MVKKTPVMDFKSGRSGMIALKLREGDEIMAADVTTDNDSIFLATRNGKTIQFSSLDVRAMGRAATGVRGISLEDEDEVVSMEVLTGHPYILNVTECGYGKCSLVADYRLQTRGGKGVKLCKVSPEKQALSAERNRLTKRMMLC
ncbi:MAG: hypothetical protein LRY51_02070 [Geovibrio sp.]|nr:hypothetical protein [Geovibrio sp.]